MTNYIPHVQEVKNSIEIIPFLYIYYTLIIFLAGQNKLKAEERLKLKKMLP
jgi:hypothetical protein